MVPTVMKLFGAQYLSVKQLPAVLDTVDRQIRLETGGAKLQREQTVFFVPDGFKPYRAIFAELYERVERGLIDASRLQDALVEVTYDFLTRWGPTFQDFGEHHRTFLYELCDRTVASENEKAQAAHGDRPPQRMGREEAAVLGEREGDLRVKRLADDVLRVVEQDLRSFQPEAVHVGA